MAIRRRGSLLVTLVSLLILIVLTISAVPRRPFALFGVEAVRILIGATILWAAGAGLYLLRNGSCDRGDTQLPPAPLIIIGSSAALGIYVLVRSLLSRTALDLTGFSLPVRPIELVLVALSPFVAALLFGLVKRSRDVTPSAWQLSALAIPIFIIAARELPRELPLSADADQHTFWLHQMIRFGMVPSDQAAWGEKGFGYPSGFAVMNYVWASVSGLDPASLVTVQPLLQTMFALAAIVGVVVRYLQLPRDRSAAVAVAMLWLYLTVLPYGYQTAHYRLEGAARISTLGLKVLILIGLFQIFARLKRSIDWHDGISIFFLGVLVMFEGLMNPAHIIVPGLLYGALLVIVVFRSAHRLSTLGRSILASASAIGVLALDPWFVERSSDPSSPSSSSAGVPPILPALSRFTEALDRHLSIEGVVGFFDPALAGPVVAILYSALLIGFLFSRDRFRPVVRTGMYGMIGLFAVTAVVGSTLSTVAGRGDLYLLEPYFENSSRQYAILAVYSLFALATAAIFSAASSLVVTLILVSLAALTLPASRLIAMVGVADMRWRFDRWTADAVVTSDDRAVMKFISQMYPDRGLDPAPRILVPNAPVSFSVGSASRRERWIYPVGAARILPFVTNAPLAFYYFQGDSDYTFQAYKAHVCRRLDRVWLRDQGIQYLFVPAEMGGACIRGVDQLIVEGEIVYSSGEARLLSIK